MTSTSTIGFAKAAQTLGVSIRTLRHAIRTGKITAPGTGVSAVSTLDAEWLAGVQQTAKADRGVFKHSGKPAVPAFARYEGTSAWRKYPSRVRDYNNAREAG